MQRTIRWYDHVTVNAYWFALTTHAQVLSPLVVPLLVQRFVGEEGKGSYYGTMRLCALMVAILAQSAVGLISDHTTSRWGRRRPYILIGSLGVLVLLALIGATSTLEGMTGYWFLLVLYALFAAAANTAHAATQGLIPDIVPEDKRGLFSGIKALLEVPIPLVFVSLVISRLVVGGEMWGALLAVAAVTIVCLLVTLFVAERPLERPSEGVAWHALVRLVLMTGVFALIIVGTGTTVKAVLWSPSGLSVEPPLALTVWVGMAGMAVAVVLGVLVSVWIAIGRGSRRNNSFRWWVVNRLAFLVAANGMSGFMLYFVQERFSMLQGEAAAGPTTRVMMLVGICILVTALPSGRLADVVGQKILVAASGGLAALGTATVVLIPDLAAIYVGGCIIGVAIGMFFTANWALGARIVPQDQAGQYLGLSNLAGAGAGAIGAYIGGPIADKNSYVLVFTIYGSLFLLSALALEGIQDEQRK